MEHGANVSKAFLIEISQDKNPLLQLLNSSYQIDLLIKYFAIWL